MFLQRGRPPYFRHLISFGVPPFTGTPMLFDKEDVRAATRVAPLFQDITGKRLKGSRAQRTALCPFHDEHTPSFSINVENGLWHCKACGVRGDVFALVMRARGCTFREAVEFLGERAGIPPRPNDQVVSQSGYAYESGDVAYLLRRTAGKGFSVHRPDGTPGLAGARKVLYGLPEIVAAPPGGQVFIVEGEPKVDELRARDLLATTSPFGARGWLDEYAPALRGLNVVILPDNDDTGRAYAETVAASSYGHAACVKLVALPDLSEGGDVIDWFALGHTVQELLALVDAAPQWQPVTAEGAPGSDPARETPPSAYDSPLPSWPALPDGALYGVMGEIVRIIAPHSEADPAALLLQGLVAFGNIIGRHTHYTVESDRHFGNLFTVIVGQSSKARKGTAWRRIRPLFEQLDAEWGRRAVVSGLASGEGLITAVRDAGVAPVAARRHDARPDEGVVDKRLLVVEEEFSSTLRVMRREGNILSSTLRQAWDKADLCNLTKNTPVTATGAHISIIGHITVDELRHCLRDKTELVNGFANRFLWVCARRARLMPFGEDVNPEVLEPLMARLADAFEHGRSAGCLRMDEPTRAVWGAGYGRLSEPADGLLGAVTSRAEAQVVRLALLYALLDCDTAIRLVHLHAALAVWHYCEASASVVFSGAATRSPLRDRIAAALQTAGRMTRDEIRSVVGKHVSADAITTALEALGERVRKSQQPTGGRSAEVWEWIGP